MIRELRKVGGALLLTLSGAPRRVRRQLFGGQYGLRILAFHDTPPHQMDQFKRLVDWVREHFDVVGPDAAADFLAGRVGALTGDLVLFTFDDGFEGNWEAASYLTDQDIRAIFFLVPSFLDRTMEQYLEYHRGNGIDAYRFLTSGSRGGLSRSQVREILAMGHALGGHNYAHRDLGQLTTSADLEYEIDRAIDSIEELTGVACQDFAIGFGRPWNVTREALEHVCRRCDRVYSIVRGVNVPDYSPRMILRDNVDLYDVPYFHRLCIRGAADTFWVNEVKQLLELSGPLPIGIDAKV